MTMIYDFIRRNDRSYCYPVIKFGFFDFDRFQLIWTFDAQVGYVIDGLDGNGSTGLER